MPVLRPRGGSRHATEEPTEHDIRQLEVDRNQNDQKLKSRFEHIFSKYGHDFDGVGDEIEIHSGEIVVNNGHIQHMRSEVDPGKNASSRFVRTFQEKLEHEDQSQFEEEEESGDDNESEYEEHSGEEDSGDDDSMDIDQKDVSAITKPSSSGVDMTATLGALQAFQALSRPAPRLAQLLVGDGSAEQPFEVADDDSDPNDSEFASVSEDVVPSATGVRETRTRMRTPAVKPAEAQGSSVDANTIQALGMSIANQLAQLMSGPGQAKAQKQKRRGKSDSRKVSRDPVWDFPELPTLNSKKRKRSPPTASQPAVSSPRAHSPEDRSLWSAEGGPRRSKRKRQNLYDSNVESDPVRRFGNVTEAAESKRCWNCSLTRSSHWKKGPHDQDLCSSCGHYYERHGRMKPFDSPTPSVEDDAAANESGGPSDEALGDSAENATATRPTVSLGSGQATPIWGSSVQQTPEPQRMFEYQSRSPSSVYSANTSRQITPSLNNVKYSRWTPEEDAIIIRLKERDRLPWDAIARYFPSKTVCSVQARYSSKLHNRPGPGRDMFNSDPRPMSASPSPGPWSQDQHSNMSPGRAGNFSGARYSPLPWTAYQRNEVKEESPVSQSDLDNPQQDTWSRKNWQFSAEEDALLVRLKEIDRLSWNEISKNFVGRPFGSIQKRYSSQLEPSKRKNTHTLRNDLISGTMEDRILAVDPELAGPSTPSFRAERFEYDEDELIRRLRENEGLDWPEISLRLDRRPADLVKHRYEYRFPVPIFKREGTPESQNRLSLSPSAARHSPISHHGPTESAIATPLRETYAFDLDESPRASSPNQRYTPAEDEQIVRLRRRGLTWTNMADHFPGRAPHSLQNHWSMKLSKRQSLPAQMPSGLQSTGTPLLRRALGNSLRRRSDQATLQRSTPDEPAVHIDHSHSSTAIQLDEPLQVPIRNSNSAEHAIGDDAASQQLEDEMLQSYTPTGKNQSVETIANFGSHGASFDGSLTIADSTPSRNTQHGSPYFIPSTGSRNVVAPLMDDHAHDATASVDDIEAASIDPNLDAMPIDTVQLDATLQKPSEISIDQQSGNEEAISLTAAEHVAEQDSEQEWQETDISAVDFPDDADALSAEASRPDLSWAELITSALETAQPPMTCKQLCAWIEDKHHYFRTEHKWKHSIRRELLINNSFERVSSESRNNRWRLNENADDPAQSLTVVLKKRGRPRRSGQRTSLVAQPSEEAQEDQQVDPPALKTNCVTEDAESTARELPVIESERPPSRHVTFSPQVTISTPKPLMKRRLSSRLPRRRSEPTSSALKKSPVAREIPDSDSSAEEIVVSENRQPQRSPLKPAASTTETNASASALPEETQKAHTSSSPIFMKHRTPASIFKTPRSTGSRISQLKNLATPIIDYRTSSPAGDLRKRVVETPVRELRDPEEDELAWIG